MSELFEEYKPIAIPSELAEILDVLRAQTGYNEQEAMSLVISIGMSVFNMLVSSQAGQDHEPILDMAIREGSEKPLTKAELSEKPILARTSLSLSWMMGTIRQGIGE